MTGKITVALAAAAIGALTLVPTVASAGHWRSHGYNHHRHAGHGHVHDWRFVRFHGPVLVGCWRWLPTRFGYAKIWICG